MVTIADTLTLNSTTDITIQVGDTPGGLDVEGDFTATGGSIHIVFHDPEATGTHWAIRWAGDHVAMLGGMVGAGIITHAFEGSGFESKKAGVLYDSTTDATYFAMVDDSVPLPLIAAAQDSTFEHDPVEPVLVDITEVDFGSFDQSGRPVSVTMSYETQIDETQLALTGLGDHDVTVKITVDGSAPEESETAVGTVTLVPIEPTEAAVTVEWEGGFAATVLMPRLEWKWSGNWLNRVPPATDTLATVSFGSRSTAIAPVFTEDWSVGNLFLPHGHNRTLNLGGNRLEIKDNVGITLTGQWQGENRTLTFTNGILRVGQSPTERGRVQFAAGTRSGGTLVVAPGTTFEPFLQRIRLYTDDGNANRAPRLDLRGAIIAGGVLETEELELRINSNVLIDSTTDMETLRVTEEWRFNGRDQGTWNSPMGLMIHDRYIGDPANGGKLPNGLNLELGIDAENHADLIMGNPQSSLLIADSGGILTAWLDTVTIGNTGAGTAVVDLRTMATGTFNADTVRVADSQGVGLLGLPPGTATIGTLAVGGGTDTATLILNQTALSVDELSIGNHATLTITVGSEPGGLSAAAVGALDTDAVIHIDFLAPPTHSGQVFGLRLQGDHQPELLDMQTAGRLTWDDEDVDGTVGIFMQAGYTYVGILAPGGSLFLLR